MVMPLYDDNPFRLAHRPLITWSLIVTNLLMYVTEIGDEVREQPITSSFGLTPGALIGDVGTGGALPPVLTLVTYMFLHADMMHILGNMVFLWVFGDDIEEAMGRWRFLVFYLSCGVLGALAFFLTDVHSQTPLIGASGAISGIVIAYLMLRPCAKITALVFGIPLRISAYWIIGVFIFLQFMNLRSASASDVAYWCHVGGMAAGAVLFPLMRRPDVALFQCIRAPKLPVAVLDSAVETPGPWTAR